MKVCFISFEYPPKIIGGMGIYGELLVKGLAERGIDTYTISRGDRTYHEQKSYRIVTSKRLYWRRFHFLTKAINLFNELNRLYKFDLVHLNGTYPITRGFHLPTVLTLHAVPNVKQAITGLKLLRSHKSLIDITYLTLKNPVGSIFDVTTIKASDRIICPSPFLARDIRLYCFADKKKIQVIPNGIDLESFDKIGCFDAALLDRYDIRRDNFILYVGRLSFLKGVQYLIEAFKIVQKKHRDLKLVILGRGDFEQELRKITCNTKGVLFPGYVASIRIKKLLYSTCLAAALPSSAYEVFPMTILESMACGKPVIASNVEGNSSIIKHGKTGFLSKPRDPASLAKFIDILFENRALGKKMGMFGRKLVEKEFTLEKMVARTLKTYESLLND